MRELPELRGLFERGILVPDAFELGTVELEIANCRFEPQRRGCRTTGSAFSHAPLAQATLKEDLFVFAGAADLLRIHREERLV